MVRIDRILCPVDLSDISKRALDYAGLVARWYGARIRALLVEPVVLSPVDFPPMAAVTGLTPQAKAELSGRLGEFVKETQARGVGVDPVVCEGFVVDEILAHARDLPADLVVLGTHGRGGFERVVLGSVTEKVLRKLACPVLTVPPHAGPTPAVPGPFTSILCATDFSNASLAALEYAMSLATEAGSTLTVVHAEPWEIDSEAEALAPVLADYRARRADEARARLRTLVPSAVRDQCRVETVLATGKPSREIVRIADEVMADLVVMGVHGRGAVDLTLFGSTTHYAIRHAHCPVLTVRAK